MTHVFSLGLAVLDTVFECAAIPDAATKYKAERTETVTGGGATNAAIAIAKLGGQASLATRLGDDAQGKAILADLTLHGVDVTHVHVQKAAKSSHSSIIVDPMGERQIINFRGAGLAETTDWVSLPKTAKAVLADTRWPQGLECALKLAREARIPGIVDVDTPLDACDFSDATHLAFARRALIELTGTDQIEAGLQDAARRFEAWVCVTDGAIGCYALKDGKTDHIPAPTVNVVDTLGAGDVWHGAFALALAEGSNEIRACRFANAAAALKCTQKGVAKGMPDRARVDKLESEMP